MAQVFSPGIFIPFMVSCVISLGTDSLFRSNDLTSAAKTLLKEWNLKEDSIKDYLQNYKGPNSDLTSASVEFMVHLFKNLVHGKEIKEAVGHTHGRTSNNILHSDTVRSFSPRSKTPGKYLFTIPSLPIPEKPQIAELRFNQHQHGHNYRKVTITIMKNGIHKENLCKKTLGYSKAGVVDISNITVPFLYKFHGNLTIKIKVHYKMKKTLRLNARTTKLLEEPILAIYSQDKDFLKSVYNSYNTLSSEKSETLRKSRAKRSQKEKPTGRKRKRNKWKPGEICKLHKFKVDFDLIGWGPWIVHPKKFNAKVCFGQCPAPITHEYTPTNHAMLQTLMRMKRPLAAPEPCCVPTKLRPLSMLYFEYDDIVVRHHQDMIAAECGCR